MGTDRPYKRRQYNRDITGQKFNRWTALSKPDDQRGQVKWLCRCECGIERLVLQNNLLLNLSKSCGCLSRETTSENRTTHGKSGTPIYAVWSNMLVRCYNPKYKDFKSYGGRGITVCEAWKNSFEAFYADVGDPPTPDLTLDRIEVNGNYEPGNVRWATKHEQANNCRNSRQITHNGETRSINGWADYYGVRSGALYYRIVTKGEDIPTAIRHLTGSYEE